MGDKPQTPVCGSARRCMNPWRGHGSLQSRAIPGNGPSGPGTGVGPLWRGSASAERRWRGRKPRKQRRRWRYPRTRRRTRTLPGTWCRFAGARLRRSLPATDPATGSRGRDRGRHRDPATGRGVGSGRGFQGHELPGSVSYSDRLPCLIQDQLRNPELSGNVCYNKTFRLSFLPLARNSGTKCHSGSFARFPKEVASVSDNHWPKPFIS